MSKYIYSVFLALAFSFLASVNAFSAPYSAVVVDARDGKVLFSQNGSKSLHPASLTKMMTLYIAFAEVSSGRMSLEKEITISRNAASKPPSKMGLRAGSKMKFKYLLRAAAIKSANDAATAIAEAIAGSEANFAKYMTQTAAKLGMKSTRFKNAHGLTQSGHYSTAADMAILGRHIIYDYPKFYNLFSRGYAKTPIGNFRNSNVRFLNDYPGADGIKTGYTRAAGYNLVATAKRGRERVIVSMFGGQSSYQRNEQVGALLDLGFKRAPSSVKVSISRPRLGGYSRPAPAPEPKSEPQPEPQPEPKEQPKAAAPVKTSTVKSFAPSKAVRPASRLMVASVANTVETTAAAPKVAVATVAKLPGSISKPATRPNGLNLGSVQVAEASVTAPVQRLGATISRPAARP